MNYSLKLYHLVIILILIMYNDSLFPMDYLFLLFNAMYLHILSNSRILLSKTHSHIILVILLIIYIILSSTFYYCFYFIYGIIYYYYIYIYTYRYIPNIKIYFNALFNFAYFLECKNLFSG